MNKSEYWDVYDNDGNATNKRVLKGYKFSGDEYHLYVDVWVMDSTGHLLLTLRDAKKDTAPGKWENTGGAVLAGEEPLHGALRELREETGISVTQDDLIPIGVHVYNNTISHIFLVILETESCEIRLNPHETVDYQWVSLDELKKMIDEQELVPEIKGKFNIAFESLTSHALGMNDWSL